MGVDNSFECIVLRERDSFILIPGDVNFSGWKNMVVVLGA